MILKTKIADINDVRNICGIENSNIKQIEELFGCHIDIKGDQVVCDLADDFKLHLLDEYFEMLQTISHNYNINLTIRDILYIKNMQDADNLEECYTLYSCRHVVGYTSTNKPIYPKTIRQIDYVKALSKFDMVFGIGPAGTGKTYLAVIHAVSLLKAGKIKKLILTRPAVEAGENLGFLPGDLKEKIDPYLRPLYDALYDSLGREQTDMLIEKQVIEIAPLAYMRGRTLDNAYVILDEAQNTTNMQMKMFLTRLGFNSKMVITGDISQIDLPSNVKSGLKTAIHILKGINRISIVEFEKYDVVRHPLVAKIIERYDEEGV
ncbi:MAG: PhoH family protein [Acholeplasmatales bacterium]|nr:PhoH family protein [Acholeplasmatales bacterium]